MWKPGWAQLTTNAKTNRGHEAGQKIFRVERMQLVYFERLVG